MIIAVEGCDGVGKTTFVNSLKSFLDNQDSGRAVRVIHAGVPTKPPLEEYELDPSVRHYDPNGEHLILDRWHWGELVYGELYRGETKLGLQGLAHVDKYLDSKGAVMIHLDLDEEEVLRRLGERGEDYLKSEHVGWVLNKFREVFDLSVMTEKHRVINPGAMDMVSAAVLGTLRESYASELAEFPTYVGPRYPEYLLLGEKRNDPSWPSAFVPQRATSGYFLLGAVSRGVLKGSGVANACEEDLQALVSALRAPRTVTLGKEAAKAADAAGIDHRNLPHPQYIRRFHNKRQGEYGEMISRALYGQEISGWPN